MGDSREKKNRDAIALRLRESTHRDHGVECKAEEQQFIATQPRAHLEERWSTFAIQNNCIFLSKELFEDRV